MTKLAMFTDALASFIAHARNRLTRRIPGNTSRARPKNATFAFVGRAPSFFEYVLRKGAGRLKAVAQFKRQRDPHQPGSSINEPNFRHWGKH